VKEITVTKLVCEEEESFTASAEKENIILQILEPGEVAVKREHIEYLIANEALRVTRDSAEYWTLSDICKSLEPKEDPDE